MWRQQYYTGYLLLTKRQTWKGKKIHELRGVLFFFFTDFPPNFEEAAVQSVPVSFNDPHCSDRSNGGGQFTVLAAIMELSAEYSEDPHGERT